MFLDQLIRVLAAFVISVVFARYLSKEIYGQYQLVLSFIGFFAILSLPGLNSSIARSVAKGDDYSYNIGIRVGFKWALLGIPALLMVAIWYVFRNQFDLAIAIAVTAFFFPFIQTYNKWSAFLIGKALFNKMAIQTITQNIITPVIYLLIIINFNDHVLYVTIAYLICISFFSFLWHRLNFNLIANRLVDPECISYGKFMTKTTLLNLILAHFDKIIVGFLDIELLAVYAIALKLLDTIKTFVRSILSVSFPKFVKQKVKIKTRVIVLLMALGLILGLFLFFISEIVITYFYTEKYTGSALLFNKLVFVLPFVFVNPLLSNKAVAQEDKKMIIKIRIVVPLISIVSSLLVIILSRNTEYFLIAKVYSLQLAYFVFLVWKK